MYASIHAAIQTAKYNLNPSSADVIILANRYEAGTESPIDRKIMCLYARTARKRNRKILIYSGFIAIRDNPRLIVDRMYCIHDDNIK